MPLLCQGLIPAAGWMDATHRSLHINLFQINFKSPRRADRLYWLLLYQLFPSALAAACGLM